MKNRHRFSWALIAGSVFAQVALDAIAVFAQESRPAETGAVSSGLADLDEALRERINAKGLRDLNRVIALIESSLDKGLGAEDTEFANNMLSDALLERAVTLMQVINMQSLHDQRIRQVRKLVTSDLRRVLDSDDPPAEAHLMLGRLLALPDGEPYEARRVLKEYLQYEDLPPEKRAEALILQGRLTKDASKALAAFDEAISLVPNNENYRLARAILLRAQGKLEEALTAVNEILESNPNLANALVLQGEIYRNLKRLDESLASFDAATQLVPQAPSPYQNRGEIYRQQGLFEKAVEQFSKVLELQPGVLLTLIHRSEAYLYAGKPELALADIELVLEKRQALPPATGIAAHRIRADALSRLDRLDEAIAEIERLAEAIPDESELFMQLALYYLADRQLEKAVEAYSGVLAIEKDNFDALRSRGDLYLNIGKHEEAITDFEQAIKIQPEDTGLLNNLAWVLATSPESELRNGPRAVELATKACQLTEHKLPHILSTLAAAFAESGDFETAIKWSQKSVEMDDPEHGLQLKKELDSYRAGKPWRERQSITPEKKEKTEPLTDTPQVPPTKVKRGREIGNGQGIEIKPESSEEMQIDPITE
ncbi:MAG: tetratricopeptide repeat protein [Pirellulales bacterium]|nr:tetratricopeptide repeat protein [Pirellulales bacterium]